jgi:predicted transcriptional regulator
VKIKALYYPLMVGLDIETTLLAAANAMASRDVPCLGVLDGDRLVGVISEADLVRAFAGERDLAATDVADQMSLDVQTADEDEEAAAVVERMLRNDAHNLLVTSGGRLAGVVSMGDLVAVLAWGGAGVGAEIEPEGAVLDLMHADGGPRVRLRGHGRASAPAAGLVVRG